MKRKWFAAWMTAGVLTMGMCAGAAETEPAVEESGAQSLYTWGDAADITQEELTEKLQESMKDLNSMKIETGINTTLSMSMAGEGGDSGLEMNMNIDMGMDMEVVNEPYGIHMAMDFGMDFVGESMEQSIECYSTEVDGRKVNYTQTVENGVASGWTGEDVDDEVSGVLDMLEYFENGDYEDVGQYTLKEQKAVDAEGKEYYVLEGEIDLSGDSETGQQIQELLKELEESMEGGTLELPDAILVDLYISADEIRPANLVVDMSGISGEVPADATSSMAMELKNLVLDVAFSEYNAIDAIEIPEEVRAGAVEDGADYGDSYSDEGPSDDEGTYSGEDEGAPDTDGTSGNSDVAVA